MPFLTRPFWFWPLCALLVVVLTAASLADPAAKMPRTEFERRDRAVTPDDLRILQRADQLLSSESMWDRDQPNRVCYRLQETFSLYCALAVACADVIGKYEHRRVAIQEVRFAIREVTGIAKWSHELKDYNNLPTTRFADVKRVLKIATERVQARLKP